ncbi:hypothetical protein JTB14_000813 [Gonioctena quinquepunctata]|nr:hypothetical protein JTB14_000813 [Gonioctena quinquepunctata]
MDPSKYLVILVVCVFHGCCKPLDPQDAPPSQNTSSAQPVQPAVDPTNLVIDPNFAAAFQQPSNTAAQSQTTAAPSETPAPAMNNATAPSVTNTAAPQPTVAAQTEVTSIPQVPDSVITNLVKKKSNTAAQSQTTAAPSVTPAPAM